MNRWIVRVLIGLAFVSSALGREHPGSRPADEHEKKGEAASQPAKDEKPAASATVEKASTTEHEVKIGGETIHYHATAANMQMKDDAGKLKGNIFFIAYEKDHAEGADLSGRPVTFVFNGGPGAAAIWLHLGTAGPGRIDLPPDGRPKAPPYRLVPNAFSWLDATDLVFIDPVGTGYSRAAEGEKAEQFWGAKADINWNADFIRLYTTLYQRWPSPKFLAGESYGTTRSAGLSAHLLDRFGLALNGVVLISVVLDFQTLSPGGLNDLPYVLYLPSYASIAWYHDRLAPELQQDHEKTVNEVRKWAGTDYAIALAQGRALPEETRREVIKRPARYTGLSPEYIDQTDLRIDPDAFRKKLLADKREIIGRFDARIIGYDPNPEDSYTAYDPSFSLYLPIYSATFNDYVRRELKYENILPYEALASVHPWSYGESNNGYYDVARDLAEAMYKNPSLHVMFASGYFDLATPFFATEYTIDHLNLSPDLRRNITKSYYHGGHMMYHHHADLEKLHRDIAKFIHESVPPAPASEPGGKSE